MRTKGEAAKAGREAVKNYQEQAARLNALAAKAQDAAASINAHRHVHQRALVDALVSSSHPPRVALIERALGLHGQLEAERQRLLAEHDARLARLRDLEARDVFIKRDDYSQALARAISATQRRADETRQTLEPFDACEPLQWLLRRGVHLPSEEASSFGAFWRVISLADRREESARQKVIAAFGAESFEHVSLSYGVHQQALREHDKTLADLERQSSALQALLDEHAQLSDQTARADELLLDALRRRLQALLATLDLPSLHARVPQRFKPLVAAVHAQDARVTLLQRVATHLEREAQDRLTQAHKISRVCTLWERRPYARIGDKTKWLVTVPRMKADSAHKHLGWCQTLRHNLSTYDRYETYSALMEQQGADFLPYDAFAFRADPRMPYEGFTRALFKDLAQHRRASGLERADADALRAAEKAARQANRSFERARRLYRKRRQKHLKSLKDKNTHRDHDLHDDDLYDDAFELMYGWDAELDDDLNDLYEEDHDPADLDDDDRQRLLWAAEAPDDSGDDSSGDDSSGVGFGEAVAAAATVLAADALIDGQTADAAFADLS